MDFSTIVGLDETLAVTEHHDVYRAIDPASAYATQAFAGKSILITGASSGIGAEAARTFARAGASVLLVARTASNLDIVRTEIQKASPTVCVEVYIADVRDPAAAAGAVEAAVEHFGRLDVLVANAATVTPLDKLLGDKDPNSFWNTFEVSLRGAYNFIRGAVPHLQKSGGRIIAIGGRSAQMRIPFCADVSISKLALQRLIELTAMEYPGIKAFVLNPGLIPSTPLGLELFGPTGGKVPKGAPIDTIQLPAAAIMHIAAGKVDWLNGRFIDAPWDMEEVERDWKEKIIKSNALVVKLAVP